METRKSGDIDDSKIGGNASAEDTGDYATEEGVQAGCNIVLNHRLVEFPQYTKKDLPLAMKTYFGKYAPLFSNVVVVCILNC